MDSIAPSRFTKGFSLLELAVLLIITGLLLSAILVGQDVLRSAESRATITQIERYKLVVTSFKDKYKQLPGDLQEAVNFGLGTANSVGDNGNGDGILQDASSPNHGFTYANGEIINFWYHLSKANMLDRHFDGNGLSSTLGNSFPPTKYNRGGFTVYYADGKNQLHIGVTNSVGNLHSFENNLHTEEAQMIDLKIDDGLPLSGNIKAVTGHSAASLVLVPVGTKEIPTCVNKTTEGTKEYNLANHGLLCQLRIRME